MGLVHGDDLERCCGEGGGRGGSCLGMHVRIKDFKIKKKIKKKKKKVVCVCVECIYMSLFCLVTKLCFNSFVTP